MTENINITIGKTKHNVSPLLFGLFLEDINFTCDGGLNSNMVRNHSFDGIYIKEGFGMPSMILKKMPEIEVDRLRYWQMTNGKLESLHDNPASTNSWYARIATTGKCELKNYGYNGGKQHVNDCAISIIAGHTYEFSYYVRNVDFKGTVAFHVEDKDGAILTDKTSIPFENNWQKVASVTTGAGTGYGRLVLTFEGSGTIDIDCVSFADGDVWGKGSPKWSQGHIRRDMVEVLKELNPKFLRFPGGCIVEGLHNGNEYHWKDTVGEIIDRKEKFNLWGASMKDKGYSQSYQIGFYEYFLLCEDLAVEPMPIVWAGLNCQLRIRQALETNSKEFQEDVLQNTLDLIEYANGDPKTNKWAKLRADAGHPEPFGMKLIGIGNENFGDDYLEKFALVKNAIDEKYPGITCIISAGNKPSGKEFDAIWADVKVNYPDVLVDEHFYKKPAWLYGEVSRYDNYPRNTAKVFLGEYAAADVLRNPEPNQFQTALSEAAFLTGIERNSDVVTLTSYAPLFCLAEGSQWVHNMIVFNPKSVLKTANYYVQQMYSTTVGDQVLDIVGELPHGVYASATETDKTIIVKIVNTNSNSVSVDVDMGTRTFNAVEVTYLQSDDMKATNKLDFFGEPVYNIAPQKEKVTANNKKISYQLKKQAFYMFKVNLGGTENEARV